MPTALDRPIDFLKVKECVCVCVREIFFARVRVEKKATNTYPLWETGLLLSSPLFL